jgi:hypothetical protein
MSTDKYFLKPHIYNKHNIEVKFKIKKPKKYTSVISMQQELNNKINFNETFSQSLFNNQTVT